MFPEASVGNRPVMHATLGTTGEVNHTPGLKRSIGGLRDGPGTLIVAVGDRRDPAELTPAAQRDRRTVRVARGITASLRRGADTRRLRRNHGLSEPGLADGRAADEC